MSKPKITLGDVFFILLVFWAILDLLKNWDNYKSCEKPVREWIAGSIAIVVSIRTYQIVSYSMSYNEFKEIFQNRIPIGGNTSINEVTIISLNWANLPVLKKLTYFQFVLYAILVQWTLMGTLYFAEINSVAIKPV
jgi:hypothetical protein